MHWEKLQEEKNYEASKYDNEVKKRLQESEKRKKREVGSKPEKPQIIEQQEKDDLLNRRRSIAETWETKTRSKSSTNNTKESQQSSKYIVQSKNEFRKSKSPKKSPAAKAVGIRFVLSFFKLLCNQIYKRLSSLYKP